MFIKNNISIMLNICRRIYWKWFNFKETCLFILNINKILKHYPQISLNVKLKQLLIITKINHNIIGRYCGSYADKLMQTMAYYDISSKFPNNKKYAHVEIGVLFGGSILSKLFILKGLKNKQSIIGIDPLTGYYGVEKDIISNVNVNINNFFTNIKKFGFKESDVLMIKLFSDNNTIKDILKQYKIISLMIDGDHSYKGIKNDWDKYSPLVEIGGIVIFDNWNDPAWEDVTKFVCNEVLINANWVIKECYNNILILQKK